MGSLPRSRYLSHLFDFDYVRTFFENLRGLLFFEACLGEGEAYRIVCDGEKVGGAIVKVEGDRGELEILFVSPRVHGRGVGYAAWRAIERMYPHVRVWGLVTPYFETRNIHFYVNRCGFHIVEFFNSHHPDPNDPDVVDSQGGWAASGGHVPVREADVVGRGAAWALLGASVAWLLGSAI